MEFLKKLGSGLFVFLSFLFLIVPSTASAQFSRDGEVAYISGNFIKLGTTIYELAGTDTRSNSSIQGWSIYLPPGWQCGDRLIVDNPEIHQGSGTQTIALRDTSTNDEEPDNPVIGDCRTRDIDYQRNLIEVNSSSLCQEAGGSWSNSICNFNNNAPQQRDSDRPGNNSSNNDEPAGPSDEDQCEADGGVWNAEDGLCLPYQPQTNDCQGVTVEESNCGIIRWLIILINVLSGMAGIVIVGAIVVGGMQYSSAGSDPQKVSAAKNRIRNAVIALLFFLFGYGILNFLIPGGLL